MTRRNTGSPHPVRGAGRMPVARPQLETPNTASAGELQPSAVFRTRHVDGELVRSHTKSVTIDHRLLVVTSA
jgi:hypothetical protein